MRNAAPMLAALVMLAGCASSSREDPVDTTLPNGTQSLVVDNTTVTDMNATEGMDALMSNDFQAPPEKSGDGLVTAPSYPPDAYTPPPQDSGPDGSAPSTADPMSNDADD